MQQYLQHTEVLFEVETPLSKKIRTHKNYWDKITKEKHIEFSYALNDVQEILTHPDEIRKSIKDDTIHIYYKKITRHTLICVVKTLNGEGFIVTVYQTSKPKPKGELLWPK
ncbi:DUF4258 domain-containing protein [Candidatus Roizmanbacteria bacterium]|nr:DUF4258 domain-containing protein [Candidatus Roizmanbacteria bacterium]